MPIQRIPFFSYVHRQTKGTGINPNGSYLNPMSGYRKVSANQPPDCPCSDLQNQEVFDDGIPTCKNTDTCNHECCPPRTDQKRIQNKNGKINTAYNYSYALYLQSRCKTYRQNTFDIDLSGAYTTPLGTGMCAPAPSEQPPCGNGYPCRRITYKPKNAQYNTQGAVTSRARLLRLKYNQKQIAKANKSSSLFPKSYCSVNYRLGKRCMP